MDIATIAAGAGAFKTATEALKGLKDIVTSPAATDKISAIQTALIDAQQSAIDTQRAHSAQVDEIRALEAKLASYEAWETEKHRYELKQLGDGQFANVLAYNLKESECGIEPAHSLCPDCYQGRIKSILQHVTRSPGMDRVVICQRCEWEAYISGCWQPAHGGTKSASKRRQ